MEAFQTFSQPPAPRPKNWLVEAILVTIFCCLPFGIVGIVYAASVNSKYNSGDYTGAAETSRQAGMWTKIGFWVGLSFLILYFILVFTIGISIFPRHAQVYR